MKQVFKFIYTFSATMLTEYICSVFTQSGIREWYNAVEKPFLTPPNIVFPIAWSILYVLIMISTFMVLRDADSFNRNGYHMYHHHDWL